MLRSACLALVAALALVVAVGDAAAQSSPDRVRSAQDRFRDANAESVEQEWARAPVEEETVTTRHAVNAQGRSLRYEATAGTLTVRNDAGMPTASLFYVAYSLEGADRRARPVTFFYNGGPGSATVWLHMGSFAPMRVQTDEPVTVRPAPFDFAPNPWTLLDRSDLVFIDMVGAGYSRPLGDTPGTAHWGVDEDADTFTRGIIRYLTKHDRWSSPKYILGESYGTLRSGAVAYQLHDRGVSLNGVMLLSSIMNYGVRQPGFNNNEIGLFPTYAAAAWHHNRVPDRPESLEAFVEEARRFAIGPYAAALAQGHLLTDADRADMARRMSRFIGLSPQFIEQANLRVSLGDFRKELLRDRRLSIGRLDMRYTSTDPQVVGDRPSFDVSNTAITGAYMGAFLDYVANTLNYRTDLNYNIWARVNSDFRWNWSHRPPGGGTHNNPNTAVDLAAAMRLNPYMKVLTLNGYFDAATPFFAAEYDMAQMMLEPDLRRNLEFTYYPAGHMMYLDQGSLEQLHADLAAFYDSTANGGVR